jgi:hypothetical protein
MFILTSTFAIATFKFFFSTFRFETSAFKDQESVNSNWLPMPKSRTPSPRPGSCQSNESAISESSLNFLKHHTLLDESVGGVTPFPLYVKASMSGKRKVSCLGSNIVQNMDMKLNIDSVSLLKSSFIFVQKCQLVKSQLSRFNLKY